jgi:hypothetical protein
MFDDWQVLLWFHVYICFGIDSINNITKDKKMLQQVNFMKSPSKQAFVHLINLKLKLIQITIITIIQ